jgi:hypothetical protein
MRLPQGSCNDGDLVRAHQVFVPDRCPYTRNAEKGLPFGDSHRGQSSADGSHVHDRLMVEQVSSQNAVVLAPTSF